MFLSPVGSAVQRSRVAAGERVYAIGDVHGELDLLVDVLAAIRRDAAARGPARTTIVLLGDVIDRGPAGAELLRGLAREDWPGLVVLRGNHEAALAAAWRGDRDVLGFWLSHGAAATLNGFGIDDAAALAAEPDRLIGAMRAAISPELVEWIERMPTSWSSGGYFFAHAGIRPGVRLDRQREDDLLWIRSDFLASRRDHGKVIVHGHTVEPGEVRLGGNRIGLDTGAHEHGVLSAVGLESDVQWALQVRRGAGENASVTYRDVGRLLAAVLDHGASEVADQVAPAARRWWRSSAGAVPALIALVVAGIGALLFALTSHHRHAKPASAAPVAADRPVAVSMPPAPMASAPPPAVVASTIGPVEPAPAVARALPRRRVATAPLVAEAAVDPYAGRVAQHLTGRAQELALLADSEATRQLNQQQLGTDR